MDGFEWALIAGGAVLAGGNIAAEIGRGTLQGELERLRRSRSLGFAQLIPYRTLVAEDVVRCANGSFLGALEVEAPPVSALTDRDLEDSDTGLATALAVAFDSSCIVHLHEVFEPVHEYLTPESYEDPILAFLDGRRAAYFRSGATSRSRHILTVTWLPPSGAEAAVRNLVTTGDDSASDAAAQLRRFQERMDRIVGAFSLRASVRRLGVRRFKVRGVERVENELLTHLASRIVGERRRIAHPPIGSAISGLLSVPMRGNFDVRVGENETQIVVVKGFPDKTREAVFASIKELGLRYEMGVRFMPLEPSTARALMKDAVDDWTVEAGTSRVADPQALRKITDAAEAMGAAGDGTLRFGHTSIFFVVRSRDKQRAKRGAHAIATKLSDLMYPSFVTSLTSEDDFFAFLPGDGYHGVRRFPLHTLNIVNIFSFHGDSVGRRYADAPQLPEHTPAVAYARNDVGVMRRLHLNNGENAADTFFGIGVGAQGSGKSFGIGMLSAGWLARLLEVGLTGIESGGSMYRFVRFLGGPYYRPLLDPGGLALLEGCEDLAGPDARFFIGLVKWMLELQGVQMTPDREAALEVALDVLFEVEMDPRLRNLSAFVEQLQDPDESGAMRKALERYTERGGMIGRALDAGVDSFSVSRITGIEIGPLLAMAKSRGDGQADHTYVMPVLAAYLWKARRSVMKMRERLRKPLPWLYMLDEAHAMTGTPQGCAFISDMLKESRKENLGLFMFSQDIKHFAECAIHSEIAREAGTGVWYRNSSLKDDEEMQKQYQRFGCSARALAEIPHLQPRTFGWSERRTGEFATLSWEADLPTQAILGRSRGKFSSVGDNARVDEFMKKFPKTWREELLRYEGVDEKTIAQVRELLEQFDESKEEVA